MPKQGVNVSRAMETLQKDLKGNARDKKHKEKRKMPFMGSSVEQTLQRKGMKNLKICQ